jgi:hypothetical protein
MYIVCKACLHAAAVPVLLIFAFSVFCALEMHRSNNGLL